MAAYNLILDVGSPYKLWPFSNGTEVIASLATGRGELTDDGTFHLYKGEHVRSRDSIVRRCEVYRVCSNSCEKLADFYSDNEMATNTGQPFITSRGWYLVPVWNVDYYCWGQAYGAIYLSDDRGSTWQCVYENPEATYLNHFYEDEDGVLYIGCGLGGGGGDGEYSYTPTKGFLLRSENGGRTWGEVWSYARPGALYSAVRFNGSLVVSAREDNSLFVQSDDALGRIDVGEQTRNIAVVDGYLVVACDNCCLRTRDLATWSRHEFRSDRYMVLRYPMKLGDRTAFGAVSKHPKAYLLFTDWRRDYCWDFAECCEGYFARIAVCDGRVYAGTEYDGRLISVDLEDIDMRPLRRSAVSALKSGIKRLLPGYPCDRKKTETFSTSIEWQTCIGGEYPADASGSGALER